MVFPWFSHGFPVFHGLFAIVFSVAGDLLPSTLRLAEAVDEAVEAVEADEPRRLPLGWVPWPQAAGWFISVDDGTWG